ncbi:MAG: hypothetical protein AAF514_09640 [Verrucomicrobiota bacterium]
MSDPPPGPHPGARDPSNSLSGIRWWSWPDLLGLLVPVAAVCWLFLIREVSGIRVAPAVYGLTGLAAWLVGAAERGRATLDPSRNALRHRLRRRYPFLFRAVMAVLFIGLVLGSLFRIPQVILESTVVISALVLFYVLPGQPEGRQSRSPLTLSAPVLWGAVLALPVAYVFLPYPVSWESLILLAGTILILLARFPRQKEPDKPVYLPREMVGGLLFAAGSLLPVHATAEIRPSVLQTTTSLGMLAGFVFLFIGTIEALEEKASSKGMDWVSVRQRLPSFLAVAAGAFAFLTYREWSSDLGLYYGHLLAGTLGLLILALTYQGRRMEEWRTLSLWALATPLPWALWTIFLRAG